MVEVDQRRVVWGGCGCGRWWEGETGKAREKAFDHCVDHCVPFVVTEVWFLGRLAAVAASCSAGFCIDCEDELADSVLGRRW